MKSKPASRAGSPPIHSRRTAKADIAEVTAYLHRHVPLTRHMGAVVEAYDGTSVRLGAPLRPNRNHRQTAFGGSIAALGVLTGWVLLHLRLVERGVRARLVIRRSAVDYVKPIAGDFRGACEMPPERTWKDFLRALERSGKARITLTTRVETAEGNGATHEGEYVAILLRPGESS